VTGIPWHQAPLVALDLEGTGAQDGSREAVLEIASVPIANGRPDTSNAYHTLVNPRRPIPTRPWTSPGLTNRALRDAPGLDTVEPALAARLNGHYLVGHNVGVDWRLLKQRCPSIKPAGLIDTLRLARCHGIAGGNGLAQLIAAYDLTAMIDALAVGSQPHRALWDTIATAVLLATLVRQRWPSPPALEQLTTAAGLPLNHPEATPPSEQPSLFEL